jgi:hypothetical protein
MVLVFLASFVIILMSPTNIFAANRNLSNEFDFDVMFVIDGSGSMAISDPKKSALLAINLFVDMCATSNSRAGYVLYSHTLREFAPLTDISGAKVRTAFKARVNKFKFPFTEDTDIALGLKKAMDLFQADKEALKGKRKPLIILLSDGNTDLPKGPRTVPKSLAELEEVKAILASKGIPVFTIGFNYDGTLNTEVMKSIASDTSAAFFETNKASQLPAILSNIYAAQFRANVIPLNTFTATGKSQRIEIPIPNQSIYEANIIILSGRPVSDMHIFTPEDREVIISDANRIYKTVSNVYTLLKMVRPQKGTWTLSLVGANGDDITIGLLSTYDLMLNLSANTDAIRRGEHLTFEAWLSDMNTRINDPSLFTETSMVLNIQNISTREETHFDFPSDRLELALRFDVTGNYQADISMAGPELTRESNSFKFAVAPRLLEMHRYTRNVIMLSQLFSNRTIPISNLGLIYDGTFPEISFSGNDGFSHVAVDYDGADNRIRMTASPIGTNVWRRSNIIATFTDQYGQVAELNISVIILNLWYTVILLLILLLIIALFIMKAINSRKPYLDDPFYTFHIQVSLPVDQIQNTPSETDMKLKHIKGRRTLSQIIEDNDVLSGKYNTALRNIRAIVSKIFFKAANQNRMSVTIPSANGYMVEVNGYKLEEVAQFVLSGSTPLNIRIFAEDDTEKQYDIILSCGSDGDMLFGRGAARSSYSNRDDFDY